MHKSFIPDVRDKLNTFLRVNYLVVPLTTKCAQVANYRVNKISFIIWQRWITLVLSVVHV